MVILILLIILLLGLGMVLGAIAAVEEKDRNREIISIMWLLSICAAIFILIITGLYRYSTKITTNEKPEIEYKISEYNGVQDTTYVYHFKKRL